MKDPTILLYNFSREEVGKLRFVLRMFPAIRVLSVEPSDQTLLLGEVLAGKKAALGIPAREFQRRMLVLAYAQGSMVHFLLGACGQITQEKVLRAMLTDTNVNWSGLELYENLVEEERELAAYQIQQQKKQK